MANRSVTVFEEYAEEVAEAFGGIVNGISIRNPVLKRNVILVTVLDRKETLKNTKEFRKFKREGKLQAWATA